MTEEKEISIEVLVPVRRNETLPYLLELQIPPPRPKSAQANQASQVSQTKIAPSPVIEPKKPEAKPEEKRGLGQAFQGLFGQVAPKPTAPIASNPELETKIEPKNDAIRKLFLR